MPERLRWKRVKAGEYRFGDVSECFRIGRHCWYWVARFGPVQDEPDGLRATCREAKRAAEKALREMEGHDAV